MVLALPGEAVAAVEVAAVGDVQAERLDVAGIIFELSGDVRIDVRRKQFFVIFQLLNLRIAFPQVCLADSLAVRCLPAAVFGEQRGDDFAFCFIFKHRDHVIGNLVHDMDGAGVGVQHNVVTV